MVDQAAEALGQFLVTHGLQAAIEHQVAANPIGDGSVQQFNDARLREQLSKTGNSTNRILLPE